MRRTARHALLTAIAPFDNDDELRVVVETPRGSRNKYKYEPEWDCVQLATVLPEGMVFPYDFGFIPSSVGDDGDPLDILILMDSSVVPGCVVRSRLIGVIEAEQKEDDGWTRNDRLIAVAVHAQTYQTAESIADLRPHLIKEIEEFFHAYNKLRGRKFRTKATAGPHRARALVEAAMKKFRKCHVGRRHAHKAA